MLVLVLAALAGVSVAYAADSEMTLEQGLVWLLSGGGAGAVTYLLIDKVPYLKQKPPDAKRYWSIGLVLGLVALAWGFTLVMGYNPMPETWREWVEKFFSISFVGLTTSLLTHGAIDLRQKRKKMEALE